MSYDNTNKGAVWQTSAYAGNANVRGTEFRSALVSVKGKSERAPIAFLFLHNQNSTHAIALFRPSREAKYRLSGKCDELQARVFVYVPDNPKQNSPAYTLSFLDFDDQRPASEQSAALGVETGEEPF